MNNNVSQKKFWSLTVIIPLLVVWGGGVLFSLITDSPFNFMEELGTRLLQTALVMIPFIVLAFVYSNLVKNKEYDTQFGAGLSLSLVTIGTLLFWGYFWFDGISYQLNNQTGGANIGLGMLMLVSPLIISALIPLGLYFGKNK
ncbi:MAG: hypothetical protein AAF902_02985 [Chloroflexota bacterium]